MISICAFSNLILAGIILTVFSIITSMWCVSLPPQIPTERGRYVVPPWCRHHEYRG